MRSCFKNQINLKNNIKGFLYIVIYLLPSTSSDYGSIHPAPLLDKLFFGLILFYDTSVFMQLLVDVLKGH